MWLATESAVSQPEDMEYVPAISVRQFSRLSVVIGSKNNYMRFTPLLLLVALLPGADREQFTLRDGRVLVGTYDDKTQIFTLDGGIGACGVRPEQVAARCPAPPEKPKQAAATNDKRKEGNAALAVLAVKQAEMDKLNILVAELKKKLSAGGGAPKTGVGNDGDLDRMLTLVRQREALQREIIAMQQMAEESQASQAPEVARLNNQEQEKARNRQQESLKLLDVDLAKYREIASSTLGKDITQTAWEQILLKWGLPPKLIPPDSELELQFAVAPLTMPEMPPRDSSQAPIRNATGMFSNRATGMRLRAAGLHGGSRASEAAVDAALRWLKKHQSPNGMWDAENHFTNCTEDPKCEPGSLAGKSSDSVNTAMTAYALLCYLGAGHDHNSMGKYKTVIKKGIDYLLSIQRPNGYMGAMNYEHPVATMALVEAYALTNDLGVRGPAQKAVNQILELQNTDPKAPNRAIAGLGWNYTAPTERNDSSVTGWNVMALKSAHAAGLNIKNGMDGAHRWLELTWKANNDGQGGRPDWRTLDIYKDASLFSYAWYPDMTTYTQGRMGHQNLAPVGLVCAVFLGRKSGDVMVETLANWIINNQTPTSYPCDTYYMYYNTIGMYQIGGDRWKTWNPQIRDMLVNSQRKGESCFDGSWDWEGTQFDGSSIGRILSTAYCCLSLEVYYRYARSEAGDQNKVVTATPIAGQVLQDPIKQPVQPVAPKSDHKTNMAELKKSEMQAYDQYTDVRKALVNRIAEENMRLGRIHPKTNEQNRFIPTLNLLDAEYMRYKEQRQLPMNDYQKARSRQDDAEMTRLVQTIKDADDRFKRSIQNRW